MRLKRLSAALLAVITIVGTSTSAYADGSYWTDQGVISTGGIAIVTTETHAGCSICTVSKKQHDPSKPNFNCGGPDVKPGPVQWPSPKPATPPNKNPEIDICECFPFHPGKPCEDPTSNCPCIPKEPCCKPKGFDITVWDKVHCPCNPTEPPCKCVPNCPCDPDKPTPGCDCVESKGDAAIHIFEDELMSNLKATNLPTKSNVFKVNEPSFGEGGQRKIKSCSHSKERGCNGKGRWVVRIEYADYGEITCSIADLYDTIAYIKDNKSASSQKYYDILRQGSKACIKFNSNSGLIQDWKQSGRNGQKQRWDPLKFGNPYGSVTSIEWISHRFAGKEDTVVLAKYMDKQNSQYLNFMQKAGVTPKQTTNGASHSYDASAKSFLPKIGLGSQTIQVKFSEKNKFYIVEKSGSGCTRGFSSISDSHSPKNPAIMSAYADRIEYGQNVAVDATYVGKSLPFSAVTGVPKVSGSATQKSSSSMFMEKFRMTKASPEFPFYGTYQMTADYTAGQSPYNTDREDGTVWMLGSQQRKFQGIDILDFTVKAGSASINTPWSRDSADKSASMPVSKAGSAYEFIGSDSTLVIDGWFHLIDPKFAPDEGAANSANQQQLQNADNVFKSIIDTFNKPDSVGAYSNVTGASTDGSIIQLPDGRVDKDKEQIRLIENGHSASGIKKEYFYLPGYNGSQTSGRDYKGQSMSVATASIPNFTTSQDRLTAQLETNGGVKKKWYNEDFEGVIIAHYQVVLSAPTVQSDYISWFKFQSDWQTALNATAPVCINKATGNQVIDAKQGFVTGVDFYLGNVSWGNSVDMHILFDPYLFGLRGSAFDNAN